MNDLKYAVILALDMFDRYVLDHRFYWFCYWLGTHPWWGEE